MKIPLLISACLTGDNVKYNGKNNEIDLEKLKNLFEFIKICPEVEGGLSIPRDPSEIKKDKVISIKGKDVTKEFTKGANIALKKALINNCKYALLKANSPSCSNYEVYDGSFNHKLVKNLGITAKLLKEHKIECFNENQIDELLKSAGFIE